MVYRIDLAEIYAPAAYQGHHDDDESLMTQWVEINDAIGRLVCHILDLESEIRQLKQQLTMASCLANPKAFVGAFNNKQAELRALKHHERILHRELECVMKKMGEQG